MHTIRNFLFAATNRWHTSDKLFSSRHVLFILRHMFHVTHPTTTQLSKTPYAERIT